MLKKIRKAQLKKRAKAVDDLRDRTARARRYARVRGKRVNYSPVTVRNIKIKQRGNSYQKALVSRYRGQKTISPIQNATLYRKFGTYTDPIYKMKIFNDSIVLKAPYRGAKVRSVLGGKVVYVGDTSVMGKVIIIQHSNHLHTIYSELAGISPLIKTGRRVSKGTRIGTVKRKLIFKATQNSKFINPLRLIKL